MATEGRVPVSPLEETLFDEGQLFEFFQAVRLLQSRDRSRAPVGEEADPRRESVRFRGDARLSFAPSDVSDIAESAHDGGPPEMTLAFLGVASPMSFGSLPLCYAEHVLERRSRKDHALRDFYDLFNHRLASLFYRAWEKHRFPIEYERSEAAEGGRFERSLFALIGLGTPGLRGRQAFPDLALLRWAGVLTRRPVTEQVLRDLIAEWFDVEVEIETFVPHWYPMDDEELNPLGRKPARLGRDTVLGRSMRGAQSRFRLRLGPLGRERYESFLPGGDAWEDLAELVTFATGPEFDYEVQLVLRAAAAPEPRLTDARGLGGMRLGWTSWIRTRDLARDPGDVILGSERRAA
ncbi:MAG: type VI secretion system baseplate subunit TssG [bacterium]